MNGHAGPGRWCQVTGNYAHGIQDTQTSREDEQVYERDASDTHGPLASRSYTCVIAGARMSAYMMRQLLHALV